MTNIPGVGSDMVLGRHLNRPEKPHNHHRIVQNGACECVCVFRRHLHVNCFCSVSCSAAVCWLYGRAIDFENFCGEFNDKVGCKIFGNGYPFLGKKTHRPWEADEPDFVRIFFFVFEVYTPNRTSQSGKLLLVQSKSTQNCFDF